MSEYVSGRAENNYINIKKYLELMKANCSELDDAVLTDGFDGFVADLISGYLDETGIENAIKDVILQNLMDDIHINIRQSAGESFADQNLKQIAGDGDEDIDFWEIYIDAAQRTGRGDCVSVFAENTTVFMQLIEKQIIFLYDIPDIKGTAESYKREILEYIQALSYDRAVRKRAADKNIFQIQSEKYLAAVNKASSDNISDLQECIDDFDELGDWKDSRELREKCENKVMQILSEKDMEAENERRECENKRRREAKEKRKEALQRNLRSIVAQIIIAAIIAVFVIFKISVVPDIPNGGAEFLYDSNKHRISAFGEHCAYIYEDKLVFGYVTYNGQTSSMEELEEFEVAGTMCSDKEMINILKRRSIQFEDGTKGWIGYNQKKHELKIHYIGETYLCKGYGI